MTSLSCSARGCRETATWALRWNNPRIHAPERRKIWLACAAHRESLEHFLGRRGFHKDTVPVSELEDDGYPTDPTDPNAPARPTDPTGGPEAP